MQARGFIRLLLVVLSTAAVAQSLACSPSDSDGTALATHEPIRFNPRVVQKSTPKERAEKRAATGSGRWHEFRTHRFDPSLSAKQRETLEALEAIGYASGSRPATDLRNVTHHVESDAYAGENLYTSGHAPVAILMTMAGEELHRWSYPFRKVWPDYPVAQDHVSSFFWRRAHVFGNGDLLAIFEGLGIIKLDRDSNLLWANPNRAHHDMHVTEWGEIYLLTREARVVQRLGAEREILEDFISVLDDQGRELRRTSLLDSYENSELGLSYDMLPVQDGDLFHTNSLELLGERHAGLPAVFQPGNVLVALRELSANAVVDLAREEIVWIQTGDFLGHHDPHVLANGHLLLFDNNAEAIGSRVLELDATGEVHWQYEGTDDKWFFSRSCGLAQRLHNGNTLITETDNGRAFEVSADKRIVWEFYNPHRTGDAEKYVASLFEMVRLPRGFSAAWARVSNGR